MRWLLLLFLVIAIAGGCERGTSPIAVKPPAVAPAPVSNHDPAALPLATRVENLADAKSDSDATAPLAALRFQGPAAVELLQAAIDKHDGASRQYLTQVLASIPDPRVSPILVQLLADSDPKVRQVAIYGLAVRKSKALIPQLEALVGSKEQSDREWALYALDMQRDPSAKQFFLRACIDSDVHIRRQGVRGLKNFSGKDVVAALTKALSDQDRTVQVEADISLCRVDPNNSHNFDSFMNLSTEIDHMTSRTEPALIGFLGESRHPLAESELAKLLTSYDDEQRIAACGGYERFKTIRDPKPLIQAFKSDPDMNVRMAAATAIGKLKPPAALPVLIAGTSSSNPQTVTSATEALVAFESPSSVATFKMLARKGSSHQKSLAAAGLLNMGIDDPVANRVFDKTVDDATSKIRDTRLDAAFTLGSFKDRKSLGILRQLADDPDQSVQTTAVVLLGVRLGEPTMSPTYTAHPPGSWVDSDPPTQ